MDDDHYSDVDELMWSLVDWQLRPLTEQELAEIKHPPEQLLRYAKPGSIARAFEYLELKLR